MSRFNLNVHSAADPRYISNIVVGQGPRPGTISKKRITHFYPRVLDLHALDTARKGVFETNELLEHILSFLPVKNIFGVQRVSKQWAGVIENSVGLQQKMFLRLSNKPRELWTLDGEHTVDESNFVRVVVEDGKDTELKFRRIDAPQNNKKCITPVTLNPMLRKIDLAANVVKMVFRQERERVSYSDWMDAFKDSNASFWNTYITDPPCYEAGVSYFDLYLGEARPPKHHVGYEYWMPTNGGAKFPEYPTQSHHMFAEVEFSQPRGVVITSDVGLKMGDVLQACLTTRGHACCVLRDDFRWKNADATIHEAMDVAKEHVGSKSIPKSPYMSLVMSLIEEGSTMPLIATDEERATANENWKQLQ